MSTPPSHVEHEVRSLQECSANTSTSTQATGNDPAQSQRVLTRARNREAREQAERDEADRILAAGPRLAKARAEEKVREWTASSTRKRTISQMAAGSQEKSPGTRKKRTKQVDTTKHTAAIAQKRKAPRLSRSLVDYDKSDSDDVPLAAHARRPLSPKPVIVGNSIPHTTTAAQSAAASKRHHDNSASLQRSGSSSGNSDEHEESDASDEYVEEEGPTDTLRATEIPQWIDKVDTESVKRPPATQYSSHSRPPISTASQNSVSSRTERSQVGLFGSDDVSEIDESPITYRKPRVIVTPHRSRDLKKPPNRDKLKESVAMQTNQQIRRTYHKDSTSHGEDSSATRHRHSKHQSHREEAAEKEHPRFHDDDSSDSRYDRHQMHHANDQQSSSFVGHTLSLQDQELRWAKETRVVYNSKKKLNKGEQTPLIQQVLDRVIEEFLIDFAFHCAIHKADRRFSQQRGILEDILQDLKLPDIASRVGEDRRYASVMMEVGEARLVLLRGKIKGTAIGLIPAQYSLTTGGACAVRVGALLSQCQYIFPGDVAKNQDYNNPFNIDIFTSLLAVYFFEGSQSIAIKYPELFKSSLRDQLHEKEIPEAMLGIVCAATALGLADWITGTFVSARDFNISLAEKYYDDALAEMHRIKTKSLKMYHRVMHQVYNNVCKRVGMTASSSMMSSGPSKIVFDEE